MSTQAEKDVLQKIVEGMDISDEELEFQDAVDTNPADKGEPSKDEGAKSTKDPQKEECTGTLEMEVTEELFESSSKSKESEDIVKSDEGKAKTNEKTKHKPTIKVRNDIIDDIFETKINQTSLANRSSTRTKGKESEKGLRNMEEETIENIQTLLDAGSEFQKSKSTRQSRDQSEVDEVNEPGVFISINSKEDSGRFLAEEDGTQNPLESSRPTRARTTTTTTARDIPQVMLDQLDLKKFPNLKINERIHTSSTPTAKPIVRNMKLYEEIHKRMELRKGNQFNDDKEKVGEKHVQDTPRRGRGRPRKYAPITPANEVKTTSKSKVETKLKTTEKTPNFKKALPLKPKHDKKTETEDEDEEEVEEEEEEEEDGFPTVSRSRSARKIKMTDKFKSFVTQEKTISKLLSEQEEEKDQTDERPKGKTMKMPDRIPDGKFKPVSKTPTAKKSEIQIKLKRKKDEISHEEDVIELSSDGEEKRGRNLRARQNLAKKTNTGNVTKRKSRKELISESELSDDYEAVDDEDMDPDFDHGDIGSDVSEDLYELETTLERSRTDTRTVVDLMSDVFKLMPTWNLHILPHTNNFCMAQIIRGVNGVPMLKKCIEMDHDFNVKVYVHQIHCKKYDGVYDSEEHLVELLQLVDAM